MKKKLLAVIGLTAALGITPMTSYAAGETERTELVVKSQEIEGVSQEKVLEFLTEVLDEEVNSGTITQVEADAKYTEAENGNIPPLGARPDREEFVKDDSMTEEERLTKFKEMLDKQVEAGKLTQEEADEKYTAIENGEIPEKPERPENSEQIDRPDDGTIPSDVEKPNKPIDKAQGDQVLRLSVDERLSLYQKILDYQVETGVITQTEADTSYEAMNTEVSDSRMGNGSKENK